MHMHSASTHTHTHAHMHTHSNAHAHESFLSSPLYVASLVVPPCLRSCIVRAGRRRGQPVVAARSTLRHRLQPVFRRQVCGIVAGEAEPPRARAALRAPRQRCAELVGARGDRGRGRVTLVTHRGRQLGADGLGLCQKRCLQPLQPLLVRARLRRTRRGGLGGGALEVTHDPSDASRNLPPSPSLRRASSSSRERSPAAARDSTAVNASTAASSCCCAAPLSSAARKSFSVAAATPSDTVASASCSAPPQAAAAATGVSGASQVAEVPRPLPPTGRSPGCWAGRRCARGSGRGQPSDPRSVGIPAGGGMSGAAAGGVLLSDGNDASASAANRPLDAMRCLPAR